MADADIGRHGEELWCEYVDRPDPMHPLPIDLAAELYIKGPDVFAIAHRRLLAELGADAAAAAGPAEAPPSGQSP